MDKSTAGTGLIAGAIGGLVIYTAISQAPSTVELDQVNDDETTTTVPIEVPSSEESTTTVLVSTPPTSPPIIVTVAPNGDVTPDQDATLEQHEERLDTLEATTTTTEPSTTTTARPMTTTTSVIYGEG